MSLIDNPLSLQQREQNSCESKNIEFIDMATENTGESIRKGFSSGGEEEIASLEVLMISSSSISRYQKRLFCHPQCSFRQKRFFWLDATKRAAYRLIGYETIFPHFHLCLPRIMDSLLNGFLQIVGSRDGKMRKTVFASSVCCRRKKLTTGCRIRRATCGK